MVKLFFRTYKKNTIRNDLWTIYLFLLIFFYDLIYNFYNILLQYFFY